ncbi:hypothetical protein LJC46_08635 [Desulfovibrio sp. OttesenSCG-928-G15]|nr:hypothetical protein [Desulfovibrio sp. OttesenSCG-928-G15]
MTTQYYNYRRNEAELNEEIIFCAANADDSRHYGNYQRIMQATSRTLTEITPELAGHLVDWLCEYNGEDFDAEAVSAEEIQSLLMPSEIVNTAGAWDNVEFVDYLYENTDFYDNYDGIAWENGAVFFEANSDNVVSVTLLEEE